VLSLVLCDLELLEVKEERHPLLTVILLEKGVHPNIDPVKTPSAASAGQLPMDVSNRVAQALIIGQQHHDPEPFSLSERATLVVLDGCIASKPDVAQESRCVVELIEL